MLICWWWYTQVVLMMIRQLEHVVALYTCSCAWSQRHSCGHENWHFLLMWHFCCKYLKLRHFVAKCWITHFWNQSKYLFRMVALVADAVFDIMCTWWKTSHCITGSVNKFPLELLEVWGIKINFREMKSKKQWAQNWTNRELSRLRRWQADVLSKAAIIAASSLWPHLPQCQAPLLAKAPQRDCRKIMI